MKFGIDGYIGNWESGDGFKYEIFKLSDISAQVAIYNQNGEPIIRPYFNNRPTIKMPADYDEYNGIFSINLWEPIGRYLIDLNQFFDQPVDENGFLPLFPSINKLEEDNFLDQYSNQFGNLSSLTKIN